MRQQSISISTHIITGMINDIINIIRLLHRVRVLPTIGRAGVDQGAGSSPPHSQAAASLSLLCLLRSHLLVPTDDGRVSQRQGDLRGASLHWRRLG